MEAKTDSRAAVAALEVFLKDQPCNKIFSFDDLSSIACRDIRKDRHLINTVMRRLIKHHSKVLVSVRGVGYQLLPDNQLELVSQSCRKSAKNKINKAYKVLRTVDMSKLNEAERDRFLVESCKTGTILAVIRATDNKKLLAEKAGAISTPNESQILNLIFKST